MAKETPRGKGTDGFEPPKYLTSLIAAINDGAKSAQAGMLLFLLVGLYLLATAFSASDEDILLGKTLAISQIGASLPVSFSFAIAPGVFVFLHAYALTRYDMLGTNIRYFRAELRTGVPLQADRERCRQLLANVEFVQSLTAPPGSSLRNRLWPLLTVATLALFPVVVLSLVQINSLRYQGELINGMQRLWLLIDLSVIVWFFIRNPLNGRTFGGKSSVAVAAVVAMNLAWLNVVPPEADADIVRFDPQRWKGEIDGKLPALSERIAQPLDLVLCPGLKWGCRYLRVEHRTLVDHVWDNTAMVDLHTAGGDHAKALAGIEGVVLRERNLRFASLEGSRLYAADLTAADLTKANLTEAQLPSVNLNFAQLGEAVLDYANLEGAKLGAAHLEGAKLTAANLRGAFLLIAKLQGASLSLADLQGADLGDAHLQGASLDFARLQGVLLNDAQLHGAVLDNAQLKGVFLDNAHLQGASLDRANLQGASLDGAELPGASLEGADLQGASSRRVFVWRANGAIADDPEARSLNFRFQQVITEPKRECNLGEAAGDDGLCNWSPADFETWRQEIITEVPEGPARQAALKRIDPTLNPAHDPDSATDRATADAWSKLQNPAPPDTRFETARAAALKDAGCDADGAPFVVTALSGRLNDGFGDDSPYPAQLAATFLDSDECPGARGINAKTQAQLKELIRPAARPPSMD